MAVSICESVNAALRENLSTTTTNSSSKLKSATNFMSTGDENTLDSQLNGAVKSILLKNIEFEEVFNYKSTQEQLKSKYIHIIAKNNSGSNNNSNATTITNRIHNNNNLSSGTKIADKQKQQHGKSISFLIRHFFFFLILGYLQGAPKTNFIRTHSCSNFDHRCRLFSKWFLSLITFPTRLFLIIKGCPHFMIKFQFFFSSKFLQ